SLKGDEVAINLSTNQGRTLETMMPAVADYLRQQRDIGRDIANFTVDSSPLPIEKPLSAENREKAINGIQALLDQVPNLQWVPLHNFLSTQHTPFAVRIGSTRVKAEYLLDNVVGLARELDSRGEEDPQAKMLYFNDHGLLARILEQRAYYQTENFLDQEAQVTSGQEEVA
ncbi:MAG: hypothetical protein KJ811_01830, partial [Candidatus Margulisbacteria bacterium]|nr:hypothetical protein [Candidatus Margulisiibacteriota bacterium]